MPSPVFYEILIRNALLLDGTGAAGHPGDLAVHGGSIARIEPAGTIPPSHSHAVIEADGLALAPGFIDAHTHDDRVVIDRPDMPFKISQGVTTVVVGNCGISLAPLTLNGASPPPPLNLLGPREAFEFRHFGEYADRLADVVPSVNVVSLIGHGTLRVQTMDDPLGIADRKTVLAMRDLLNGALSDGASGFSTGLYYPINAPSDADEVVALAELLPEYGGVYATHMRNEHDRVMDSLEETFTTASRAQVPVIVSHHKCAGRANWGRTQQTLPYIEQAAAKQPIGLDAYPYTAGSTVLDPRFVQDDIKTMVSWCEPYPEMSGRDLGEIAKEWGCSMKEAAAKLSPAGGIFFQMDEDDVRRVLRFPLTMIGSDGLPQDSHPHPRLWGTFPRVLGHYARDVKLFSLEEAVRKMTGLTAQRFGLSDRGLLREGYAADLVLFDPAKIGDTATFADPIKPANGIERVIVNGVLSYTRADGVTQRAGRLLRGRVTH
ncbi:MAG TPA: D-aminoacylase [Magnetospirillaceae bacterium]|jgi:N-acyl-D-aspartate/D-glutamate deacylase